MNKRFGLICLFHLLLFCQNNVAPTGAALLGGLTLEVTFLLTLIGPNSEKVYAKTCLTVLEMLWGLEMYNSPIGLVIFQNGNFPSANSSKLLFPECLKGGEKPFKEKRKVLCLSAAGLKTLQKHRS